jgi:hypothetical protein
VELEYFVKKMTVFLIVARKLGRAEGPSQGLFIKRKLVSESLSEVRRLLVWVRLQVGLPMV